MGLILDFPRFNSMNSESTFTHDKITHNTKILLKYIFIQEIKLNYSVGRLK